MRKLNIRQGVIGGGFVALMSAAGVASRSPDPLTTFASILAFALACVGVVVGLAVLVNRSSQPPVRW